MRRPFMGVTVVVGMGWLLSQAPSVLVALVYFIPIIILCLIVGIVKIWITGSGEDDEDGT